jgi:hypothetical protein
MGGNRFTVSLILNLDTKWWWVVTLLRRETTPVPFAQDTGWVHRPCTRFPKDQRVFPGQLEPFNSVYILLKGPTALWVCPTTQ